MNWRFFLAAPLLLAACGGANDPLDDNIGEALVILPKPGLLPAPFISSLWTTQGPVNTLVRIFGGNFDRNEHGMLVIPAPIWTLHFGTPGGPEHQVPILYRTPSELRAAANGGWGTGTYRFFIVEGGRTIAQSPEFTIVSAPDANDGGVFVPDARPFQIAPPPTIFGFDGGVPTSIDAGH